MMDIIVGSAKAFVRLCNKKDFSHLPERRLVVRQEEVMDRSDMEEAEDGGESEPVKIEGNKRNRICIAMGESIQGECSDDSDEEFPSTEDSPAEECRRRRRRRERISVKEIKHEQLMFILVL